MQKLWYTSPARLWREALPIGNGYTAAMLFGGKRTEKIAFNDATLWSGYPKDYNDPTSLAYLQEVRELIFAGKQKAAEELAQKKLCGFYSESFLPLGDLKLTFCRLATGNYRRELDLQNAVYTVQTAGVRREAFASTPDRVVVYRITADRPFNVTLSAKSKLHSAVSVDEGLNLTGNAPDYVAPNYLRTQRHPVHYEEGKGMAFALRCEADTDGHMHFGSKKIRITGAKQVTLYCTTATGFNGYREMPDTSRRNVLQKCRKALAALTREYEPMKQRHIADYQTLWNRQSISFSEESPLPTDQLLANAKGGSASAALCELLYNYGKYMIIAGSRPGGEPLNLQGQWNSSVRPPWSSNYTVNINTQMNYWGAGRAHLTECIEPLVRMVYETMCNGRETARINYGCGGFACNHNVDLWRKTPPVQGTCNYMLAPLCGVWLANEVFRHYQNGGLADYADKIEEIAEEAARFASEYLILHDGYYVICPSTSPENEFRGGDGVSGLDYASAFDMGLVRQSFKNYLSLERDDALSKDIREKLPKLYPFGKGSTGILEWHADFETPEKGHRHFSPLYAFYPGNLIGYHSDPEKTGWISDLFHFRLQNSGQHIGWSAAWAISLSARLHDAQTAKKVIDGMLANSVFKNLFCVHPPFLFQIDGNLGFVAGINETLVYEENGILDLLPAAPDIFKNGSVRGMFVNGASVSFAWTNGVVTAIESDREITVRRDRISPDAVLSDTVHLTE